MRDTLGGGCSFRFTEAGVTDKPAEPSHEHQPDNQEPEQNWRKNAGDRGGHCGVLRDRRDALRAAVKRDIPLQGADVVGAVSAGYFAWQVCLKQNADGLTNVLVGFGKGLQIGSATD